MDWLQVIIIIAAIAGMLIYFINRIENDVEKIGNRLDGHAQRIDQLYKMFVDLLKERK